MKQHTLEENFYHIDDDLLVKHLLGEASPDETRQVNDWLAGDALHLAYYSQLKAVWQQSQQLAAASTVDENQAWKRFQQRVQQAAEEKAPARQGGFSWMRVAAAVLLVAGLAWLGYYLLDGKPPRELLVQSKQQIVSDTLGDGSIVTLNKNSSVRYASAFTGKTRPVVLQGEAFFNIAPDKEKPFVINVQDIQVTVVGTSFNINSHGAKTDIVVETGIVRVAKGGRMVELKAGEKLHINAGDSLLVKEPVTDRLYNYYRTREFICDNTPLWKLVEVVNEAYNVQIELARKELRDLRINSPFYNESLEQVLNVICLTFELKAIRKDGKIILE